MEAAISNNRLEDLEYYLPFPEQTMNFAISVYDLSGSLLFEKNLKLPFEANKRTIVRGKLFSSLDNKDLEIIVDDSWDEDIEYPLPE